MEKETKITKQQELESTELESVEESEVLEVETVVEETVVEETKDWRDSVYGNIKMSVKTLDIVIGAMVGFIVMVLLVGAIKNFL